MSQIALILISTLFLFFIKQIKKDRRDYFEWLNNRNQFRTKNI